MKRGRFLTEKRTAAVCLAAALIFSAGTALLAKCPDAGLEPEVPAAIEILDTIINNDALKKVTVAPVPAGDESTRYGALTEEDFRLVAGELGVEVAAIKAVVSIEAGAQMKGFWAPGVPVINFDRSMYNRFASKAKVKTGSKGEKVPSGLSGYALREWTQLVNARKVNCQGANLGTFWGMFQIGGFNYKMCGCESIEEFVRLMSDSELEQLELFAAFITNSGMLPALKAKDWATFARKYNGASYARRGYHTRMAAAYKKYKQQENQ